MNPYDIYHNPTKLDVLLTAARRLQANPVAYAVHAMLYNPAYYSAPTN